MEGETMNKVKNRRTADNCLRIYTLGRFEVYRNVFGFLNTPTVPQGSGTFSNIF